MRDRDTKLANEPAVASALKRTAEHFMELHHVPNLPAEDLPGAMIDLIADLMLAFDEVADLYPTYTAQGIAYRAATHYQEESTRP